MQTGKVSLKTIIRHLAPIGISAQQRLNSAQLEDFHRS